MQSCECQVCPKKNLNTQRFVAERLVIEGRVAERFVPEILVIGRVVTETLLTALWSKGHFSLPRKYKEPIHKRQHERESVLHELNHNLQKKLAVGRDANTDMWENVGKISCYLLNFFLAHHSKPEVCLEHMSTQNLMVISTIVGNPRVAFVVSHSPADWSPAKQALHWEQAKTSWNPLSCFRSNFSSYPILVFYF